LEVKNRPFLHARCGFPSSEGKRGVYRCTEDGPTFVEAPALTDEALQALLHNIIARVTRPMPPRT